MLVLLAGVVLCRTYWVGQQTAYAASAGGQSVQTLTLPRARGDFYDRTGRRLTGLSPQYYALCLPGDAGYTELFPYVPNRSAFIALVEYEDGAKSYILAPDGLKVGDTIMAGPNADIKPGNALPFENIPVGTMIHNIELYPGKGGQLVRSAGVMAQLMAKENGYALVRLPSGEMRNVRLNCIATIGVVSNLDHENVNLVSRFGCRPL